MSKKQKNKECGFRPQKIADGFTPFAFVNLENIRVEDISIHKTDFRRRDDFFEI